MTTLDPNEFFPTGAGVEKKRCQTCFNLNWFCACGLEDEDPLTRRFVKDFRVGNRVPMTPAEMIEVTVEGIRDPERVIECIQRAASIVRAEQDASAVLDAFNDLLGTMAA